MAESPPKRSRGDAESAGPIEGFEDVEVLSDPIEGFGSEDV